MAVPTEITAITPVINVITAQERLITGVINVIPTVIERISIE